MQICLEEMPVSLKPIYAKAPLVTLPMLPLLPGQVQAESEAIRTLCAALPEDEMHQQPTLWEGLIRGGAMFCRGSLELPAARWTMESLAQQQEDGSLPGDVPAQIAIARAALALYEYDTDRSTLVRLLAWCGHLDQQLDETLQSCAPLRQHPADLLELLEKLYRITGKQGLVSLCRRVRLGCMDWTSPLRTHAQQLPMSRVTPWSQMETEMQAEEGDEEKFFTRQYLTCHGEALADGGRAAMMSGLYSGSAMEQTAWREGWKRISRYHGAVCGGLTCDELLAGGSPSSGVDSAALGAWAETFCAACQMGETDWSALELMLENAMPRAVQGGKLRTLQRVNELRTEDRAGNAYHLSVNRQVRAAARLLRGYAAAYSCAVTQRQRGVDINLYLPGRHVAVQGDQLFSVVVEGGEGHYALTLRMKQDMILPLRLRIPAWAENARVTVPQEDIKEGKPGTVLTLQRTWHDGDVITCDFPRTLRTLEGYHRGRCAMLGSTLLCMPATEEGSWAMAMVGDARMDEQGRAVCAVLPLKNWKEQGGVPADLPVLPKVRGEEREVALVPYASACGIALFPKGTLE